MSSSGASKSTTLRGPKFDEEISVERVSSCPPVNTWKVVHLSSNRKALSKEKTLKSKESPGIETANRFDVIKDASCNLDLLETTDISNERKLKSEKDTKRKAKKNKRPKDKKQKSCSNNLLKAKKSPPVGPCVPKAERCSMCLVSHTPFYKFCRWATKRIEKIKEKYEDNSVCSENESSFSRELIEMIQSRIKEIEEGVSLKQTPTLSTQEQDKKNKLEKKIISSAEACAKKFLTVSEDKSSIIKYCTKKI